MALMSDKDATFFPYLHGFNKEEQARLYRQAEFMEATVYHDIDFTETREVIEIGCGVGAQSAILLRRFPKMKLTCIDMNDTQLEACRGYLATLPYAKGRYEILKGDAGSLAFEGGRFDGAFLCWTLEHVSDPKQVLSEVRRVMSRGGRLYGTEVMNHSFFLDPYSPNVWKYWMAFNDYQLDSGGDPFIGAKLGNLLSSLGYRNIQTKIINTIFDNRQPEKRRRAIEERKDLLLSAAERLIQAGATDSGTVQEATRELELVQRNPNAVILDAFMQVSAEVS